VVEHVLGMAQSQLQRKKYLRTYYVLDTILGAEDLALNKQTKLPCWRSVSSGLIRSQR
jgi:hypothetical protein